MDRATLVLLPGHLCNEWVWEPVIHSLKPAGGDPLIIPLGAKPSIAALADEVEAKLPPGKIALAGFSLGGMVALELLKRIPQRIDRLALIDTTAREAEAPERAAMTAGQERFKSGDVESFIYDFVTFLSAPSVVEQHPALITETVNMMLRNASCFESQQQALMHRPDHLTLLGKINCPTTVIYGALDMIAPPEIHHEMAKLIQNCDLVEIPMAGHMTLTEKPDLVADALKSWLSKNQKN